MNDSAHITNKATHKSAKGASATDKEYTGFTQEEKEAMKERAKELKRSARRGAPADEEGEVLAKIDAMAEPDRAMARRIHSIVKAAAPDLSPRLWYGMPAYARDGKVICFFQDAAKFKSRYATLGFSDKAHLDDGEMWPVTYALNELTPAEEARIIMLVKKAVG